MTRRTCPTCPRRYAGLVDPNCPVCDGVGVIALGSAALYRNEPAVVARSIELYLEAACRQAARDYPPGDERLAALGAAAARLRDAGVISTPLGVADPENPPTPHTVGEHTIADVEASRLAHLHGADTRPQDRANLDAPQVLYGPDDRPHANGTLPVVSADGWRSAMVKAADPRDALGPSTRALVYARQSTDRAATVLANAVDRACDLKTRRAATA